jgi:hypothetical protein
MDLLLTRKNDEIKEHKRWYTKPKIHSHYFTLNNKRHGEYKEYRETGDLQFKCQYKNNMKCGTYTYYFMNGSIAVSCHYMTDVLHGPYTEYDIQGDMRFTCDYTNGHILGHNLYFNPYGEISKDIYYSSNHNYAKEYDWHKKLMCHIGFWKEIQNTYIGIRANYSNNKLCAFFIENESFERRYIYNISKDDDIIIDLNVINPIRIIQLKFRSKKYNKILNELNRVIIDVLSRLIMSYLKN